jgi:sterol 3beta-glucosyltransferase
MRLAILADGTRGDFAPMAALGARMTSHGHEVSMTASEEFRPMVEAAGLRFVALPVSLTAYISTEEGRRLLNRNWVFSMRGFQRLSHDHREGIEDAFIEAGDGAEALVTTFATQDRAQCLAIAREIPHAMAHSFPLLPTGEFASSVLLMGRRLPAAALCRASHHLSNRIYWLANRSDFRAFARRLGLASKPRSTLEVCANPSTLVLQAFSPSLIPKPGDWGDNHILTGFWWLPRDVRAGVDEEPPEDLVAWTDAGERPVFLGFGSMPVLEPRRFLAMATEATRALGVRAIVNAPWADSPEIAAELPDHLRLVGSVNHDRLLPRCAAAVHHGGAGTVAASLRAGLPTMVCSVWVDQPFWGKTLERLGVGAHVPFKRLDAGKLEAGLRTLLSQPVRRRAAALGASIRAEGDGSEMAARLLDEWLSVASAVRGSPGHNRVRPRQATDARETSVP